MAKLSTVRCTQLRLHRRAWAAAVRYRRPRQALVCRRRDFGARDLAQQPFWPGWRVDHDELHGSGAGVHSRMINVGRYIYTCAGANFHGRLIVDHWSALTGYNIDNLFRAGMIMSCVPFSLRQFNDAETEAVRIGDRRFAEEVDFSPVKFHAIDIVSGSDNARSKFLHRGRGFCLYR